MKNDRIRQIVILIMVAATILVNALANALPINGQTTGEISDSFDVFFVPAGYVFSIWGVIYLGLVGYAIYQLLPAQDQDRDLRGIGGWFILSSIANISWILLWHYEYFLFSVAAMLVLLISLTAVYLRLGIGKKRVSAAKRLLVHLPFSIYLGWITVATIANVTTLLESLNWSGWGISEAVWAVIMLAVATVVGGLVSFRRGDVAYAAVLVWAFVGIAIKHSDNLLVSSAAWAAAGATAILLLAGLWRRRQQQRAALLF